MRFPAFLKPGDKVGILSPARKITPEEMAPAMASLTEWGLEPVLGHSTFQAVNQFAGSDTERLEDTNGMLADPSIKAILFSRGGYGCLRIVDDVDWGLLRKHPKWLVGFSDLTAFNIAAYREGVATIHGPMGISWNGKTADVAARAHLRALLMGELPQYAYTPALPERQRTGQATGRLIGGNLSILSQLIGTATDFDTRGAILFLEDIDEYLYHIDRMVVHLRRAGKLEHLAGLVVGGFSDLKDNETPFGKSVPEIVLDALDGTDIPVCFGFPTGHWPQNYPLVNGATATLSVSHSLVELSMELR